MKRTMQLGPINATFAAIDSDFENLMQQAFTPRTLAWIPAADIFKTGDNVTITVELPGMSLENIDIEVEARTLTVSGKRVEEEGADAYLRKEIRKGEFARSFRLPSHVTAEDIVASYEDGILSITVHRAEEPQATKIPISRAQKVLVTQEEPVV